MQFHDPTHKHNALYLTCLLGCWKRAFIIMVAFITPACQTMLALLLLQLRWVYDLNSQRYSKTILPLQLWYWDGASLLVCYSEQFTEATERHCWEPVIICKWHRFGDPNDKLSRIKVSRAVSADWISFIVIKDKYLLWNLSIYQYINIHTFIFWYFQAESLQLLINESFSWDEKYHMLLPYLPVRAIYMR